MIYVVIAEPNKSERDCRITRQPHYILPEKIKVYIEKAKNEEVKRERTLAYTTLLCSLEKLFSVKEARIEKNQNGKPYLKDSDIYISISHCDGFAVLALSDEGEIGVDIQSPVDEKTSLRLECRFLSDIQVKNQKTSIKYLSACFTEEGVIFNEIFPEPDGNTDFLSKWVYSESVMKCFGDGFSGISKIAEISDRTETEIVCYNEFKIATTVAK